jgi:hypothetical protein
LTDDTILEKWTKNMFGGKRIFFGDTGRIVVDFSVILFHFSRNELIKSNRPIFWCWWPLHFKISICCALIHICTYTLHNTRYSLSILNSTTKLKIGTNEPNRLSNGETFAKARFSSVICGYPHLKKLFRRHKLILNMFWNFLASELRKVLDFFCVEGILKIPNF